MSYNFLCSSKPTQTLYASFCPPANCPWLLNSFYIVRVCVVHPLQHNSEDVSALHCALANGHQEVVDWLLSLKAVQKLGEVQDILLLSNGAAPTRETVTCPFKALLPRPKLTTSK